MGLKAPRTNNSSTGTVVFSDLQVDGTTVVVDETNDRLGVGTATPRTRLTVEGPVTLKEQASADGDTAAYGQLWVKTATPNELYFTTDAGNDIQITSGTATAVSSEVIQDVVGAMVGSNTETGITVSYEDSDGTLDFVLDAVGTNAIADDAVTVAKIEDLARGQIIYGNASAETAKLSPGNANTVLTSDGTDISWQAPGGGGTAADDLNLILHTQVFS
tara:strand:+ start:1511 stop:2164 length:654 start_codon:yes stop_codon:yes gene_type:complete